MIKRLFAILALLLLPNLVWAATTQTALATDTFVRANAANLGANWTNFNASQAGITLCNIASNKAQVSLANGNCASIYSANDFPNDQFAQVTMGVHANTSVIAGACVDAIGNVPAGNASLLGVTSFLNGYCSWIDGSNHYRICSTTSGLVCQTQLATSATTPAAGDVILLTVQQVATGRQLTLYINGAQIIQTTDIANTYTTGFPGMDMSVDATVTDVAVTNFVAGAVSTPPTIVNSGIVVRSTPTLLGSITSTAQAVQFSTPAPTMNYGARLQIIANGQVSNPSWVLEVSQDGGFTWFQMPMLALPGFSPQLGDTPTGLTILYDISGLGNSLYRFGLANNVNTVITGTINIFGISG